MKYQGKYWYLYLGWNGVIINVEFYFRNKYRNLEFSLFGCSVGDDMI